MIIGLAELSPTHTDIAVVVGGSAKYSDNIKTPSGFGVEIARKGTSDTLTVMIPWNETTLPQIRKLKETVMNSHIFMCGVKFKNLVIRSYTDKKGKTRYRATADNIEIIIR